MKVVRTFHPVGQGAFYSERFYEGDNPQAKYNIVFDSGTSWGTILKAKKLVTQAFDKNDKIDYLFISHLDYDHVSLVNTLMESVDGKVRNIVLPLVNKDEVRIGINLNFIANHQETEHFLRRILDFMDGSNNGQDTHIEFIGENDNKVQSKDGGKDITLRFEEGEPDWVLIPRNVSARSRRDELLEKLDKMLADTDFREKSHQYGLPIVGSGEELLNRLLDKEYVDGVIRTKKLRNAIKSAYEKVAGGVNVNSLLLYSGPATDARNYMMYPMYPNQFKRMRYRRVGCLYTGDCDCDIDGWKSGLYSAVWQNIGTIQLPHHGSLKSFDVKKNNIDRVYYFPVSCGSTNSYGHPSGKVLAYLVKMDGLPQVVTEMANTVCMQEIERGSRF
jgi:beta-lactamase superfamily II metal-dependent hydrolase